MGTLEVRGRGVEVACPELDDAELAEDEGPHAGDQGVAREDGIAIEQRAGGVQRGDRIAAQAPFVEDDRRPAGGELDAAVGRDERLALLGEVKIGLGAGMVAASEQRPAEGERELRRGLDEFRRHRLEDRPQGAHLAVDHHVEPACPGQVGGEVPGAPGGCMA